MFGVEQFLTQYENADHSHLFTNSSEKRKNWYACKYSSELKAYIVCLLCTNRSGCEVSIWKLKDSIVTAVAITDLQYKVLAFILQRINSA
jgi:hypothetical protein